MEREEGCGGTFAPERLHSSHTEASARDFPHYEIQPLDQSSVDLGDIFSSSIVML